MNSGRENKIWFGTVMMNGWMRSSDYVEEENGKSSGEIHDLLRLFATHELLKKKAE